MRYKKIIALVIGILLVVNVVALIESLIGGSTTMITRNISKEEISTIKIDDENSTIEIKKAPFNDVVLSYPQTKNEAYQLTWDEEGTLKLTRRRSGFFSWFSFGFKNEKVTLELPEKEFELFVRTRNGKVEANDVTLKETVLETTNGKVVLNNSVVGRVRLVSTNGEIRTENVMSHSIFADTTNGGIKIHSTQIVEELKANTTNGSVYVGLKGSVNEYRVDCTTTNGSCDIGPIGTGNKHVHVSTTNGNVKVEFNQ